MTGMTQKHLSPAALAALIITLALCLATPSSAYNGQIGYAKSLDDGARVTLTDKVLYLNRGTYGYIEEPDRAAGIRVEGAVTVETGHGVTVDGVMATTSAGERYVQIDQLTASGLATVSPLGVNGRAAVDSQIDGLFIRAWGRVQPGTITGSTFAISDGFDNISVLTSDTPDVSVGQFVAVDGAAGLSNGRVIHRYTPESPAASHILTSTTAAEDSYVYQAQPDYCAGSEQVVYLVGGRYGSGAGWSSCGLWQWTLPHPAGQSVYSVDSARVRIWTGTIPAGSTVRFYRLTQPFDESTVTWGTRPAADLSTYVDWTSPGPGAYAFDLDVSSLLANNGDLSTFGIMAEGVYAVNTNAFYQKENTGWPSYGGTSKLTASYRAKVVGNTYYLSSSPAAADSEVRQANPATCYGNQPTIYTVGSSSYEATGTGWCSAGLWQWSLPHPVGCSIQAVKNATVRIWTNNIAQGQSFKFYRLTQAFAENTITWNNRPQRDLSTYIAWTSPIAGWYSFDLDVSNLLANNGDLRTFGIVAEAQPGVNADSFLSKEHITWPSYGNTSMLTASYSANPAQINIKSFVPMGVKGLFYPTETPQLNLKVKNGSSSNRKVLVHISVRDFSDTSVHEADRVVALSPFELHDEVISVPAPARQGFYGVKAVIRDNNTPVAESTSSFCMVTPMPVPNPFFGMTIWGPGDPAAIRRMGAGTIGCGVDWADIEAQKGIYNFTKFDAAIQPYLDQGIRLIGFPPARYYVPGAPWATPTWLEQEVSAWRATHPGDTFPPSYFEEYGKLIGAMVNHYKDRIHIWSFYSELDIIPQWIVDVYRQVVPVAAAEARKADPNCILGGVGVSGYGWTMAEQVWSELAPSLDGMFFDPYIWPCYFGPGFDPSTCDERAGFRNMLTRARDLIATYGKNKLSVEEKGFQILTSLPIDSPYTKHLAKVIARSFVMAKSVPEVDRYLYFMATNYHDESGSDFGLWKNDCPRPTVAAYATTARMLLDTSNPVEIDIDNNARAYVFTKGSGSIAVIWTILPTPASLQIDLPHTATAHDLMGNTTANFTPGANTITLTDAPLFMTSPSPAPVLSESLGHALFTYR